MKTLTRSEVVQYLNVTPRQLLQLIYGMLTSLTNRVCPGSEWLAADIEKFATRRAKLVGAFSPQEQKQERCPRPV